MNLDLFSSNAVEKLLCVCVCVCKYVYVTLLFRRCKILKESKVESYELTIIRYEK